MLLFLWLFFAVVCLQVFSTYVSYAHLVVNRLRVYLLSICVLFFFSLSKTHEMTLYSVVYLIVSFPHVFKRLHQILLTQRNISSNETKRIIPKLMCFACNALVTQANSSMFQFFFATHFPSLSFVKLLCFTIDLLKSFFSFRNFEIVQIHRVIIKLTVNKYYPVKINL